MRQILTLCMLALAVMVQPAAAQSGNKAKDILDAANTKMKNLKSLKANFSLELVGSGVNEKKTGIFYLKGEKYRIQIAGQEIINDTKTIWTYIKATNEVQITENDPDNQAISPAKLFTNFYDKEYDYHYAGKRKIDGKECDVIELSPKDSDKGYSKVQLAIDKNKDIVGGQVWEKNGNTYKYTISGYLPNAKLGDEVFTFDAKKFPGVEVIDLR